MTLNANEIIVTAYPVKAHNIEYFEEYITVTQNRTRRRIYNGFYFDENYPYIYISDYYAHLFQHKKKPKKFIVDTFTKEWRIAESTTITKHKPTKLEPINNQINDLKL